MKRVLLILLCATSLTLVPVKSHAIIWTVVQAAAKKVIKAIDLQVQRMQNKTIGLQNAQKVLENAMSKLKLEEISGWVEKQRQLYQTYYDELWKVRNVIAYYKRIREIMEQQVQIVDEFGRAWSLFQKDDHFTSKERTFMYQVYSGILDDVVKDIDQLLMVINSFTTEMTDAKRLELIAGVAERVHTKFSDLRTFNNSNALLSLQRARDASEIKQLKTLYGIE